MKSRTTPLFRTQGFALVEVLAATFVLALALTGMLQMQLVALRTQQQNIYSGRAARLAADMAEMIFSYGGSAHGGPTAFMLDYRSEGPPASAPACYGAHAAARTNCAHF